MLAFIATLMLIVASPLPDEGPVTVIKLTLGVACHEQFPTVRVMVAVKV